MIKIRSWMPETTIKYLKVHVENNDYRNLNSFIDEEPLFFFFVLHNKEIGSTKSKLFW